MPDSRYDESKYLPYQFSPSKPHFVAPQGAIDAHCHVFGPDQKFPFSSARKYAPCAAPEEVLFALRDHLGFERNVIVQASCLGTDNCALEEALIAAGDKAHGVAVIDAIIADADLESASTRPAYAASGSILSIGLLAPPCASNSSTPQNG